MTPGVYICPDRPRLTISIFKAQEKQSSPIKNRHNHLTDILPSYHLTILLVASGCHSQGTYLITLDGLALTYKGTLGLSTAFLGIATASYMLASAFDELLNRITSNSTVSASLLALDAVIGKCYTLVEATALASNLVREHPTQPHLNPYYGGTTETT